jgi:hypothetical protein
LSRYRELLGERFSDGDPQRTKRPTNALSPTERDSSRPNHLPLRRPLLSVLVRPVCTSPYSERKIVSAIETPSWFVFDFDNSVSFLSTLENHIAIESSGMPELNVPRKLSLTNGSYRWDGSMSPIESAAPAIF